MQKSFHYLLQNGSYNQSDEEAKKALKEVRVYFEKYHKNVSSLIIEPLVQCAGNMKMHSPLFVKGLLNI
jgi:adenosylmethionine-8-amino-7-oxononanoate aminotransferase